MAGRGNRQVAALPVRIREGTLEVMLVTSRETRRWIIPKGWPMKGLKDWQAAAVEAKEEAGLKGRMMRSPIGTYTYWRRTRKDFRLTEVAVYVMRADKELKRWKEKSQRERGWFGVLNAADLLQEPELSTLVVRLPITEEAVTFLAGKKVPSSS